MVNEFKNAAGVTFPQGFKAAGVKAGIKKSGNLDVAVIYTEKEAVVAGTFTQNAVAAAPVFASKAVVATGTAHAIVANAGCANACTGEQGEKDAKATQEIAAKALGCAPLDVIVASTGVIGVTLPFFSAGGSSVVMMYLCVGIVLSVGMNTRRSKLEMQQIL